MKFNRVVWTHLKMGRIPIEEIAQAEAHTRLLVDDQVNTQVSHKGPNSGRAYCLRIRQCQHVIDPTENRATYNSSPLLRYHQQEAKQATQRNDKPVDVERVNEEIRTEEDDPSANRKASQERERRDASYMANLKQADHESNDEAP